jgi:hypothetical protein
LPASHPARVTIRAGLVSVVASLTPSLIPLVVSPKVRNHFRWREFLRRELGPHSFPFSVIVAIGGGAWLEHLATTMKKTLKNRTLSSKQVKFNDPNDLTEDKESMYVTVISTVLASLVAIHLLQGQAKPRIRGADIPLTFPASTSPKTTPSLDLTIILAVRATDGIIQHAIREYLRRYSKNRIEGIAHAHTIQKVVEHVDVLLYSLAAWRYVNICYLSNLYSLGSLVGSFGASSTSVSDFLAAMDAGLPLSVRWSQSCSLYFLHWDEKSGYMDKSRSSIHGSSMGYVHDLEYP